MRTYNNNQNKIKYSAAQDRFIAQNYPIMSKSAIAVALSTKRRTYTKNMIISRYTRIPQAVINAMQTDPAPRKSDPKPPPAYIPPPLIIKWSNLCGNTDISCRNQPIKFSSHGLCHKCNAVRLDNMPRANKGVEVFASGLG